MVSSFAKIRNPSFNYPKEELDRLWKLTLLNQFHDVLPGSSIEIAYDDPLKFYQDIHDSATNLLSQAFDALLDSYGDLSMNKSGNLFLK